MLKSSGFQIFKILLWQFLLFGFSTLLLILSNITFLYIAISFLAWALTIALLLVFFAITLNKRSRHCDGHDNEREHLLENSNFIVDTSLDVGEIEKGLHISNRTASLPVPTSIIQGFHHPTPMISYGIHKHMSKLVPFRKWCSVNGRRFTVSESAASAAKRYRKPRIHSKSESTVLDIEESSEFTKLESEKNAYMDSRENIFQMELHDYSESDMEEVNID